jgi:hypothetical protein
MVRSPRTTGGRSQLISTASQSTNGPRFISWLVLRHPRVEIVSRRTSAVAVSWFGEDPKAIRAPFPIPPTKMVRRIAVSATD